MQRGQQAQAELGSEVCTGVDIALTRVFELLGKRWTGLIVAVLTQRAALNQKCIGHVDGLPRLIRGHALTRAD